MPVRPSLPRWDRRVTIVGSKAIDQIAYHFASRQLLVHFVSSDSSWIYEDVPAAAFGQLTCAYSVGQCFNERIRSRFEGYRFSSEMKVGR